MPFINAVMTGKLSGDVKEKLVGVITDRVLERTGKPKDFIMVRLQDEAEIWFREGKSAAYIEVRLVGELAGETKRLLTTDICQACSDLLGLSPDHVYVVFGEVPGANWGWNNRVFG